MGVGKERSDRRKREMNLDNLMELVAEYEIEDEINDIRIEDGYMAAVRFVYTYIEDGAYAQAIVEHLAS